MSKHGKETSEVVAGLSAISIFVLMFFLMVMNCAKAQEHRPGEQIENYMYQENDTTFVTVQKSKYTIPELHEIKLIEAERSIDVDGRIIRGMYMDGNFYVPFQGIGVIAFRETYGNVPPWQHKFTFKMEKIRDTVIYTNLDIPFQFADIWINKNKDCDCGMAIYFKVNMEAARITAWLDGEKYKEFIPGKWETVEDGLLEAYFGLPSDGSGKNFKLEVESIVGEVITYSTKLTY